MAVIKLLTNKPKAKVTIQVKNENDVLKRITLLHTALLRVVQGTKLIEVCEADYQKGYLILMIENYRVTPSPSGRVSIEVEPV